jgi:hypothetical protein
MVGEEFQKHNSLTFALFAFRKGGQMNEAPEDLHHRLDQLRLLATETTDPLAERLVRDMIAELEDRLTADLSQPKDTAAM